MEENNNNAERKEQQSKGMGGDHELKTKTNRPVTTQPNNTKPTRNNER